MITLTPAEDLIEGVAMRLFRVSAHMLRPWPGEAQWHDITDERRMLYRVMAVHAWSLVARGDCPPGSRPPRAGFTAESEEITPTRAERVHADLDAATLCFDMAPTLARLRLAFEGAESL